MPVFNIKDSEARALATRLTRITGESLTTAVKRALRGRLASEAYRDFGKGAATRPDLIYAIASHMFFQKLTANRSCSDATTFRERAPTFSPDWLRS